MIIGFDASRINKHEKTGVEWYSYYLLRELINNDKNNKYKLYLRHKLDKITLTDNFKQTILSWPFNKFWTLGRLSLEILLHPPDLLFVPAHNLPPVTAKHNVVTWHDLAYLKYPQYYSRQELKSLKYGSRQMVHRADKIITVSKFSKSEIIKHYQIPDERIEVIPLGINQSEYQANKTNHLKRKYLIYVGRIEHKKNVINLLKAFEICRQRNQDLDLILAGPNGYGYQEILTYAKNSEYSSSIKFLGWINQKEKINLIKNATALIFPSFYEGFGIPILEAFCLKTPVIASQIEANKEIGADATLYFSPENYEELSEKISLLITNDDLSKQLITKGASIVNNYSWQNCALKTIQLFQKFN